MSTPPTLLLVDDDAEIRDQMKWALASDYRLLEAVDQSTALAQVRETRPPVILLDLGLPPDVDGASEGLSILRAALELHPTAKIIVITGNSDRSKAIAAMEGGAYDFIEKPIQLDLLKVVLQRAIYRAEIENEQQVCQEPVEEQEFEGIVGSSELMKTVFQSIVQVGPTALPVLITGESGTGKELVAQAIHRRSTRKDHPFIAINCGAIPETLLESELFGFERGAFTGAVQQKKGRIEYANGGTLFLDEIGDIPLSLQVKLLRFLQEHEMQRLGGKDAIRVDVRILAATNVDLHQAIQDGRFREDLYYRLCVIEIAIPPLNQRDVDIPLLARTFMLRFADEQGKPVRGITPQAIEALLGYHWPGNVRELENRIKRAVLMAEGRSLTPTDLGFQEPTTPESVVGTLKTTRQRLERDLIQLALDKNGGNVSKTALELGVSRPTLYQLLARYGLKK